jgi:hypothetical protein
MSSIMSRLHFRKLLKGQDSAARGLVMPSVVDGTQEDENIEQKSLIYQPANANDRCEGSNPPLTRNDSCRYIASFGISFALAVTCYGRRTTVWHETLLPDVKRCDGYLLTNNWSPTAKQSQALSSST